MIKLLDTKKDKCVECGSSIDQSTDITAINSRRPQSGDICICYTCGHLYSYHSETELRELNDEEVKEWAGDPRLKQAIGHISLVRAGSKH